MIKFWWRSGSPSGCRDCFPDSSLFGGTESGINRLRCAAPHCSRDTGKTRLGGGMHCPIASSFIYFEI